MKTEEEVLGMLDVTTDNIVGDVLNGKIDSHLLGIYKGWWEALQWVLEEQAYEEVE